RYELKTRREIGEAAGARDVHTAVLERLAQRLEDMLLKFRELIEKQDATMRERDFTGMRRRAASDPTRDRDGVVRSAERSRAHEPAARCEQPGDAPDGRDLDGLIGRQRRQNPGKPASQHRLSAAWRADEEHVMAACGGDLERALGVDLAAHVGEISVI